MVVVLEYFCVCPFILARSTDHWKESNDFML
jgi:hypothetical protein